MAKKKRTSASSDTPSTAEDNPTDATAQDDEVIPPPTTAEAAMPTDPCASPEDAPEDARADAPDNASIDDSLDAVPDAADSESIEQSPDAPHGAPAPAEPPESPSLAATPGSPVLAAAAQAMLQRFSSESAREEADEDQPLETPTVRSDDPFLTAALRQMRALVARAELHAELHSQQPEEASTEAVVAPAIGPVAGRFVCLTDGALVQATELLEGPRRGAAYLSAAEAEAQCHKALAAAEAALCSRAEEARTLAGDAAAVPLAWDAWLEKGQASVDAGYAQLRRALDDQQAAARLTLQRQREDGAQPCTQLGAQGRWHSQSLACAPPCSAAS